MLRPLSYCPHCAQPLQDRVLGGEARRACADEACGFVHWDNPVPVVAAVVEHEGRVVLARNKAWPVPFYALITGFLEKTDTSPESAVQREVVEELGLRPLGARFIGNYTFARQNQIILAYHVPAEGEITLGDELLDAKRIEPEKVRCWPGGTGDALRDWLRGRGVEPVMMDVPKFR